MAVKIGINGFGRIGRQSYRAILEQHPNLEVVAFNDIADAEMSAHLLRWDSNYGRFSGKVEVDGNDLVVNGKRLVAFAERNPADLPWKDLGVDLVIESTGLFTSKEKAEVHITSGGAKKVIISAPAKGEDITIVLGVNEHKYDPAEHHIISNASCTTNCLAPAVKVVFDTFGITAGLMTTIHSYTNDQVILDYPHSDLRRARSAAVSMIPTSTGAAKAVGIVIPALKGKFDGISVRVPTPTVSLVDCVIDVEKATTTEELHAKFKEAEAGPLAGILGFEEEELVSVDYKGDPRSSIVDAGFTKVFDGVMIKLLTWYDNEWGYSVRTADLAKLMADKL